MQVINTAKLEYLLELDDAVKQLEKMWKDIIKHKSETRYEPGDLMIATTKYDPILAEVPDGAELIATKLTPASSRYKKQFEFL